MGLNPASFQIPNDTFSNPRSSDAVRAFKASIKPQNLRLSADGVRVKLSCSLREATLQLPHFGPVLCLTRNDAALLSHLNQYPPMTCSRELARILDPHGNLSFRLNPGVEINAVRESVAGVNTMGLELRNSSGCNIHRCCLTRDSDWNEFLRFVRHNQSNNVDEDTSPARRLMEDAAATHSWMDGLIVRKRELLNGTPEMAKRIDASDLLEGIESCLQQRRNTSVTVFDWDVVQSQRFVPTRFEVRDNGHHLSNEHTHWQFNPQKIAELWRVRITIDGDPVQAIEAYDCHDQILFSFV